jgi:hypothetical protein
VKRRTVANIMACKFISYTHPPEYNFDMFIYSARILLQIYLAATLSFLTVYEWQFPSDVSKSARHIRTFLSYILTQRTQGLSNLIQVKSSQH